jgi:O-methyltransferase
LFSFICKNKDLEGDVLEVGVWKGGTGCILAKALNEVSSHSKIILIDTFEGVVKAGVNDTTYKGGEHADTSKEIVEQLIIECQVKNVSVKTGIFPDTATIDDTTKLRLCHIDVDTYDSAKDIFNAVWPYIVIGGAVIFDDYGFWGCEGVTILCNELSPKNASFIYNLNGHAIFIKNG